MNEQEAQFSGSPAPPDWLKGRALREWRRIVKILEPWKLATDADVAALAAYCQSYAEYVDCVVAIREADGLSALELRRMRADQAEAHRALCRGIGHFGLSPADRAGVASPAGGRGVDLDTFLANPPTVKIRA
jgi:P27 family predicted phage terminase small subunit